MVKRCYDEEDKDYKNYGAKGITICERWLCFENYVKDVKIIDGYNRELILSGELQLDKDLKGGTEYNRDNCIWITRKENLELSNSKQFDKLKSFKAFNTKTNETIVWKGINSFAKEYNMTFSCIVRCLNNERKSHHGWTFEYIN